MIYNQGMTNPSFLWHDYETFGADPRRDRPAQFAAVRTDADLQPIDKPIVIFCQPGDEVLPQPAACLITGITPQIALEQGLPEHEFAAQIHQAMSQPGTCSVGYNNFRFDDEVSRFMFWRNFYEPYSREYSNGNSRFDLIDLMRMTRALRPEGIEWSDRHDKRDEGTPSFRLEDLASANNIDTTKAHDALADVEATLAMARLIQTHQPKLWNWALTLRQKHKVSELLEPRQPLVHSTSRFPASHCGTSIVLPIAPHPSYSGQWIVWDLRYSPEEFQDLNVEELGDRLWVSKDDLPAGINRLPVKLVRANRCPMLAPLAVMTPEAEQRMELDLAQVRLNAAAVAQRSELSERISELFKPEKDTGFAQANDPELGLYDGFVPRSDSNLYPRIREADATTLARLGAPFQDERLNTLLFRYRARHFYDSLNVDERDRWGRYRRRRLIDDPELGSIRRAEFEAELEQLQRENNGDLKIIKSLTEWLHSLELNDLS